jgi:hypothetical protein
MSSKKRSKKEFQEWLHSLFANKSLKVKYKNPSIWVVEPKKTVKRKEKKFCC